jgi:hypothetical protein
LDRHIIDTSVYAYHYLFITTPFFTLALALLREWRAS